MPSPNLVSLESKKYSLIKLATQVRELDVNKKQQTEDGEKKKRPAYSQEDMELLKGVFSLDLKTSFESAPANQTTTSLIGQHVDFEQHGLVHLVLEKETRVDEEATESTQSLLTVNKALLPLLVNGDEAKFPFQLVQQLALQQADKKPHVAVMCMQAGKFAGGIFAADGSLLQHKTFSRYVKRQKQGKAQSTHDKQTGNSAQSAGAQTRRELTNKFLSELKELITKSWKQELSQVKFCVVHAPGAVNTTLMAQLIQSSIKSDNCVIQNVPFAVPNVTLQGVQEVFDKVFTIQILLGRLMEKKIENLLNQRGRPKSRLHDEEADDEADGEEQKYIVDWGIQDGSLTPSPTTPGQVNPFDFPTVQLRPRRASPTTPTGTSKSKGKVAVSKIQKSQPLMPWEKVMLAILALLCFGVFCYFAVFDEDKRSTTQAEETPYDNLMPEWRA